MSADHATALLLIAVPIEFYFAFFELGRTFDYPNILHKEPDEILRRFAAGGPGLILRWEALLTRSRAGPSLARSSRSRTSRGRSGSWGSGSRCS